MLFDAIVFESSDVIFSLNCVKFYKILSEFLVYGL